MVSHPIIVLVRPQLGWNIGAAARAMANFGLDEMRLVKPRGRHPSASALRMASGAEDIVERAQVFDNLESAVADLSVLLATSARRREMVKEEITPKDAAMRLRTGASGDSRSGILFGPERAGLENDELVLAEALVKVPTHPGFSSLNLGQCVLLLAYEYFLAGESLDNVAAERDPPATREDMLGLFAQLEDGLEGSKFFHPVEMRAATVRKIRNFFVNARPNTRQLRMLRGIISSLRGQRRPGDSF